MQVAGRLVMIAAERRVSIHGIAIACFVLMAASIAFLIVAGATPALLIAFVILFENTWWQESTKTVTQVSERMSLGKFNFRSQLLRGGTRLSTQ